MQVNYVEDETDDDMNALEEVLAFHVGEIYAGNFSVGNPHNSKINTSSVPLSDFRLSRAHVLKKVFECLINKCFS